jgi:hypothetical protein
MPRALVSESPPTDDHHLTDRVHRDLAWSLVQVYRALLDSGVRRMLLPELPKQDVGCRTKQLVDPAPGLYKCTYGNGTRLRGDVSLCPGPRE